MDKATRGFASASRSEATAARALIGAGGGIALLGVAVFAAVSIAVQFLRPEYNWIGMPLSFYAIGPYGHLLQAAFCVLAIGLAALGCGWYLALDRRARSAAPPLLFSVAAIALVVTAFAVADVPKAPATLHGATHVVAAATTFLCVTVAMLLQSWRLRLDPRWRRHFRSAFALAAIAFVALWTAARVRPIPRGLGEKVVIALILAWLWRASWWLVRSSQSSR